MLLKNKAINRSSISPLEKHNLKESFVRQERQEKEGSIFSDIRHLRLVEFTWVRILKGRQIGHDIFYMLHCPLGESSRRAASSLSSEIDKHLYTILCLHDMTIRYKKEVGCPMLAQSFEYVLTI